MKFLLLCPRAGHYRCDLYYATCVTMKYIAPELKKRGHEVKVVVDATTQDAINAIKSFNPDVVFWAGHGNVSVTTLQHCEVFIADQQHCGQVWGNVNREILDGKIALAESCLTAACLGKTLTKYFGCKEYLGFYKEFAFVNCMSGTMCPEMWGCVCGRYNPTKKLKQEYHVRDFIWTALMICMHEATQYYLVGLAMGLRPEKAAGLAVKRFEQWKKWFVSQTPKTDGETTVLALAQYVLDLDRERMRLCRNGDYVEIEEPDVEPGPLPVSSGGEATLNIQTNPSGAEIYVDGKNVGKSPVTVKVEPGTHTITANLTGYESATETVSVEAGKTYNIMITLHKKGPVWYLKEYVTTDVKSPAPPKPEEAIVNIQTNPSGAEIYVDGKNVGKSPVTVKVEPGTHKVTAVKEGYAPATTTITVEAGKVYNIVISLTKKKFPLEYASIAITALGLLMMPGGKK